MPLEALEVVPEQCNIWSEMDPQDQVMMLARSPPFVSAPLFTSDAPFVVLPAVPLSALRVCARALTSAFAQLLSNKKLEDWMYTGGQANFRTDPLDAHEGALRPTVAAAPRLPAANSPRSSEGARC